MREAAIRHTPLTVLTVHPAISGFYGGVVTYPGDLDLTEKAREAAQAETDKVLAGLDGPHPESVSVSAVHGFVVEEIIKAASDADMVVVGSRGVGGFTRLMMGSTCSQVVQHAPCPVIIIRHEDSD
jgi:nucleotide-binding universal stress UspA family protein